MEPTFCMFVPRAPATLRSWRPVANAARWDRHYLVRAGYRLAIEAGSRIVITRLDWRAGLRLEGVVLAAAFPLDPVALGYIHQVLPDRLIRPDIDGRTVQTFVDTMAMPQLVQVSVCKRVRRFALGGVSAAVTEMEAPDFRACATMLTFQGDDRHLLTDTLDAMGYGNAAHRDFEDWLRDAHAKARLGKARLASGNRAA